jgi:hypothetical protein
VGSFSFSSHSYRSLPCSCPSLQAGAFDFVEHYHISIACDRPVLWLVRRAFKIDSVLIPAHSARPRPCWQLHPYIDKIASAIVDSTLFHFVPNREEQPREWCLEEEGGRNARESDQSCRLVAAFCGTRPFGCAIYSRTNFVGALFFSSIDKLYTTDPASVSFLRLSTSHLILGSHMHH